ncbi:MAG TPA: DUF2723 domain-containing protein [candidate division Zixibacteria bacterium]
MKNPSKSCEYKYGHKSWFLAVLFFTIFLGIYWRTACTTIFWWDSAEFVAAIATLGIPHPPSFPLYVLLGKAFSFLPVFSLSLKLNLLSGIFSALSLAIFFLLFLKVTRIFLSELAKNEKLLIFSSTLLLLVAGLNYAFWIQGVRAEVYSLNGLLFILLFFCGVNYLYGSNFDQVPDGIDLEKIRTYQKNLRWLYLFFFVFGLGMGNHNVTLLSVFPAFIYLFICYDFHNFLKLKNLAISFIFFILGCSVYLYLPLRAINSPVLNWGNPSNLGKTITAVLALKSVKQIGFALNYTLWERTKDAWGMISSQLTFLPFFFSLIGSLYLIRKNFKLFIFFLFLIIGNSLTIIVLPSEFISTSTDFQGYILPIIFSFAILFGFGILFILKYVYERVSQKKFSPGFKKSLVIVFTIFFLSISFLPFLTYYRLTDLSKDDLAYRYGMEVLSQAKKNSVLFIDNPNLYFILCALKYGEGYRNDVAVLDRGLLKAKWNCQQERSNYPEYFSGINSGLTGEDLFLALMSKGLRQNLPLYLEFTEGDSDLIDFLYPAGFLFKIEKKITTKFPDEILVKQMEFEEKYFTQKEERAFINDYDAQRMFVFITYRWGLYYEKRGMIKEALKNYSMAGEQDPFNLELQNRIESLKKRIHS